MPDVSLSLFGAPRADGPPGGEGIGSKPLALLTFLALEPGPHRREELAALLWGDAPEEAARASLRQALAQLRPLLGPDLQADRHQIGLCRPVPSDVERFLAAADRSAAEAAQFEVPRFLGGFSLRGAGAFDEWAARTRRRLLQRYEAALREVAQDAVARCRWREALGIAERWLETDPLSEEATGAAMQALHCLGDRGAALARYQELRARLAEEASATPLPWLADLARRIERSAPTAAPEDLAAAPCFEGDLVGREAAWADLAAAWAGALRGAGGAAIIEGEAGVGKTRLAEEFGRWVAARGGTWLRGQCWQAGGAGPFGPMATALRGVLEAPGLAGAPPEALSELSRLVPEIRARFAGVPAPPPGGTPAGRQQLFEGIAQVLLAAAAEGPVLLTVDDAQWCDADSCALLQFLGPRLGAAPILLVTTVTEGEMGREAPAARLLPWLAARGAVRVTLEPFSRAEVWELVRQLGNIRAPQGARRFAERLHEVTAGNPFHVIELLKSLFSAGAIGLTPVSREWVVETHSDGPDLAAVTLPRAVREAIAHRVDRLPYELRDVLATVAMAQGPVSLEVLTLVHGMSRLRAAALGDALIERHLLRAEEGAYVPAHPTIASVVRGMLSPARAEELRRVLLAARAGGAEAPEPAALRGTDLDLRVVR